MPSRLFVLSLLFPIVVSGQIDRAFNPLAQQELTTDNRFLTGFEINNSTQISAHSGLPRSVNFLNAEVIVGTTLFDLQTNASLSNRMLVEADGAKVATWMLDLSFDDDHPDRGTGLNRYQGEWMEAPTARIESRRTGWSSVSRLGGGSLVVTSHTVDNELVIARQNPSEGWSDTILPTITPKGRLWPHSASGGPDNMSVHLVALSTPTAFEGEPFLGMEGQLLYNRSIDGGETWDVVDAILPGLDSTQHLRIDPDAYAILSEGNTVAVVHFGGWGDITLFKSLDNGDTWESTIIKDFPLDRYVPDSGYTLDDIPVDTLAPDALAILTSSGEGDLAMGPGGTIHVTYADMYVRDSSMEDEGTTFYPFRSGISYWNESMEDPILIASSIDYDSNDTLSFDIREIARYGNSTLTSNPSISLDGQGGVYVTYSAVSEAHFNELDEQNYRHLVVVKSLDNGVNWGPMYDLINDDLSDPEFNDFIEAVYPSTAMVDADTLHILYQQDFFPGHRLVDSMDVKAENAMIYLAVPTDLIPYDGPVPTRDYQTDVPIQLFPNPANNEVNIASREEKIGHCQVQVLNLTGQVVHSSRQHNLPAQLELGFLPSGPYLIKVSSGVGVGWQKLIMR